MVVTERRVRVVMGQWDDGLACKEFDRSRRSSRSKAEHSEMATQGEG